ncbi:mannose-1-phosphate guanylyltransferase/mannose-6-phosphate isomerase [Polynucleobacter sp. MWH-Aus1W21]|uniref:mannose-1-phosphate guanylyltransferase/mannose-6-phosphate isomerase n=1 Tax=Polynucleobacter sp. MWH-Aus1W21 TaxID=1855880 RepID=UPI001BFE460E|nr:mannose-1-phosphate guanylyltransferase/mannose-6-phosphate isomerase [Polynucleobacter sp. MWH-Aus1W21]QWD66488.1 mannose-1-phosphate guanylyltransferase/mannose-6-phosphate isomerase [Polynucleobacter sp. MWH-Aus1W21]
MKLNFSTVIICGGAGSRLWPVSRENRPKVFMPVSSQQSLLSETASRIKSENPWLCVVTSESLGFQVLADLKSSQQEANLTIIEPLRRNTAPAVLFAAMAANDAGRGDIPMLVLPADHVIQDKIGFEMAVAKAVDFAKSGNLVTFGIPPTHPETGYGYLKLGGVALTPSKSEGRVVEQFVEKPALTIAEQYVSAGNFHWNSGMFCFTPKALLQAANQIAPNLLNQVKECWQASGSEVSKENSLALDKNTMALIDDISLDYAIMEKASNVVSVNASFDWDDVGSWDAMAKHFPQDEFGNATQGKAIFIDSSNNFVFGRERLIAAVGLDNLIIVDTPDALLISAKGHSQSVKKVVDLLNKVQDERATYHSTVHRPWGTYTVIEEGPDYKIKRIVVQPGGKLSLQMHHHRNEHWVVISGKAEIINGDKVLHLNANESTYIPKKTQHRLTNLGDIPLVIIEAQVGEYLGEDDIIRFDDQYGRL